LIFFNEVERDDVINKSTRDLYSRYSLFCAENNFNPMSNVEFSKAVKKRFDVDIRDRKIQGKKYRVFCEKGSEKNESTHTTDK
jgi:putative DNA primase/helicase